jgi:putative membrane protein
MKKSTLLFVALFGACILQACHSNEDSDGDDTTSAVVDTSKNVTIVVGKDDAKFVTDVAEACLAEIEIGSLAKTKGVDKRVKNLGAMLVKDLTKGHGRLVQLAKSKKITLPDSVSAKDQLSIATLSQKSRSEFDHAYLEKMKNDYKNALVLFQTTSRNAFDPQIKGFATKNVLTIQRHLDLIDAINGSLK